MRRTMILLGAMMVGACAGISLTPETALAQKSGGGGGGGGGGGSKSISVSLLGTYYGPGGSGSTVAKGQATLTYSPGTGDSGLTVQISNVNLPDGTLLDVILLSNGLFSTVQTPYYTTIVWEPQHAGVIEIQGGKGTLTLSTANGDLVPLFGTLGTIGVTVADGQGLPQGDVVIGSYSLGSKKPGGRP